MNANPKTKGRPRGSKNKAAADVRELARVYTKECIATLYVIMKDSNSDQAKAAAARELLDRGWGRPSTIVEGTGTNGAITVEIVTGVPR